MKQNVLKRTLAGVLAVLSVAAYVPASVGAGGVITGGTSLVASAEGATEVSDAVAANDAELLENAINNGSVKLTDNISLTKTLEITADTTIDLNGFNITATDARAFHVKSGTLTLTGNGTVSSEHTDGNTSFASTSSVIRVGDGTSETGTNSIEAKLTINKDVTVSSNWCYGVSVFGTNTVETVNIYGKIIVNGEQPALSGLGTKYYGSTTINLYPGSVIKSQNEVAIYHPQAGNMNVDGSTIEGVGGIEAKGGTINISGDAVITATGTVGHIANNNGTSTDGYAIAAVRNSSYAGNNSFEITGGTFTGKIGVVVDDNNTSANYDPNITITGGKFTDDVSAYVGEGYAQNPDGTVVTQADYEWVLNESKTYTLGKDTTVGKITVAPGVKATLDLDGYDLTLALESGAASNRSILVGNGAELTIKNSSVGTGGVITAYSQSTVDNNAKLYISSGVTLTQDKAEYTIYYKAGSIVTVHGNVENRYASGKAAISGNHNNSAGSTLNIMNGAVLTEKGNAIYHPQDGTLNVEGGTISGETGIYARTGNINISGSSVIEAYGNIKEPSVIANGAEATGDALALQSHSSYGAPVVTISGGTFKSNFGKSVASYAYNADNPTITITGGTFSNTLDETLIADGYYQKDDEVVADERVDLSKAKIVVNDGKAYSIGNTTINVIDDIKVTIGNKELVKDEDYRIYEGDTSANDVGTYVFKIEGLGNYKGTAKANWTISSIVNITVFNGDTSDYFKSCQYGKSVTVTPPSGITWDETCYWEVCKDDGQWEVVSYSQNYSFIALKDVNLRVGSKEEVSEKSVLTMSTSKTKYNNKNAIKFTFNRSIDEKYTVKEVGILYATNKLAGADTTKANYKTANLSVSGTTYGVESLEESLKTLSTVKKFVANYKKSNGTVEFSYALSADNIYANAIGYVTVYDPSTKETKTLYTNVAATNYNNA